MEGSQLIVEFAKISDKFIPYEGVTDEMVRRSCTRFRLAIATILIGLLAESALTIVYILILIRQPRTVLHKFETQTCTVLGYIVLVGLGLRLFGNQGLVARNACSRGRCYILVLNLGILISYLLSFILTGINSTVTDSTLMYVRAVSAWLGFFLSCVSLVQCM
jgi:uncharacterized membrane protein